MSETFADLVTRTFDGGWSVDSRLTRLIEQGYIEQDPSDPEQIAITRAGLRALLCLSALACAGCQATNPELVPYFFSPHVIEGGHP